MAAERREPFGVMRGKVADFSARIADEKLRRMFQNCFYSTLETTVRRQEDGSVYVITGDIDAMWLRDSAAQVLHYVPFAAEDADAAALIRGVLARQMRYICLDPYANAFNEAPNGRGHRGDLCEQSDWVWEKKYETDSLCYPFWLAFRYHAATGDCSVFDETFFAAFGRALDVFVCEQRHAECSGYSHYRPDAPHEPSIPNRGKGNPVAYTGMTWSGYRPSDDPCTYGYFVPGNFFAAKVCEDFSALFSAGEHAPLAARAAALAEQIRGGIAAYAVVRHPRFGAVYACETDGLGHRLLMDDANVPSLLSLPWLGCVRADDPVYKNTRRFVLSAENPYYFEGSVLSGVGSPHTPQGYVWHIGVIMQALTAESAEETEACLAMLLRSGAGREVMHEGVDKDDAERYTRDWFAWANSMFAQLVLEKSETILKMRSK